MANIVERQIADLPPWMQTKYGRDMRDGAEFHAARERWGLHYLLIGDRGIIRANSTDGPVIGGMRAVWDGSTIRGWEAFAAPDAAPGVRSFVRPVQALRWVMLQARPIVWGVKRDGDPMFPWVMRNHDGIEHDAWDTHVHAVRFADAMARRTYQEATRADA